jgi:hypothetical protein
MGRCWLMYLTRTAIIVVAENGSQLSIGETIPAYWQPSGRPIKLARAIPSKFFGPRSVLAYEPNPSFFHFEKGSQNECSA